MTERPDPSEAATLVRSVPSGTSRTLEAQAGELVSLLAGVSEEKSLYRFETGKWSLREVLGHINDTERVFAFRAFWFARGFDTPLPDFDQTTAAAGARAATSHGRGTRRVPRVRGADPGALSGPSGRPGCGGMASGGSHHPGHSSPYARPSMAILKAR
jgi:hypothetical protein